ncbi:hypothetical protein FRC02_007281 [Tulasnella sp. 418]|nr:hypothetical protein FRC02_007281 [Tulasnella sp. 418]
MSQDSSPPVYSKIFTASSLSSKHLPSHPLPLVEWSSLYYRERFNIRIRELDVQKVYLYLNEFLKRNRIIEDFTPELAWSLAQEPIAIRPASESAMYIYYAKRIQVIVISPSNQINGTVCQLFKSPLQNPSFAHVNSSG